MWNGLVESDVVAMSVVLACGWLVLQRMISDRWQRRFRAIKSPLIESPPYRVLFLLVVVGLLLIAVLPEAAFVLPAIDAVGLDIVTIFVALELRHYVGSVARRVGVPTRAAVYLGVFAVAVSRCRDVLRTNPVLWLYACMWPVIWIRTHVH